MAFAVKIDYCGLVEATKQDGTAVLLVRDHNYNGTEQKYQPNGQNGDFVLTHIYGSDSAPSNTYALKADVSLKAGAIKLNKIVDITEDSGDAQVTRKYALENVKITTKGGSPVSIEATCQEIEGTATDARQGVYWIPAFKLSTRYEAQDIFGAFTMNGSGCHLLDCTAEMACTIAKDDVAGDKISSDADSGIITVSGTILSTSGNVPTITPSIDAIDIGNGMSSTWVLTKTPKPTEQNPEKACKQYTFELQLPLQKFRQAN